MTERFVIVVVPSWVRPEIERLVVVAEVKTALLENKLVEVAEVVVEFTIVRLVMVEVALLARIPLKNVDNPVTFNIEDSVVLPITDKDPEEVRSEDDTLEPAKEEPLIVAPEIETPVSWSILLV